MAGITYKELKELSKELKGDHKGKYEEALEKINYQEAGKHYYLGAIKSLNQDYEGTKNVNDEYPESYYQKAESIGKKAQEITELGEKSRSFGR